MSQLPSSSRRLTVVGAGPAPIMTDAEMEEVRTKIAACFDSAKDVVVVKQLCRGGR
jgi:hypothetical protein